MFSSKSFDPAKDIKDLAGKVIVVTGGNSGLGLATVRAFAQHNPARIYLSSRSVDKGNAAIAEVKTLAPDTDVQLLELDLADFDSVTKAADKVAADNTRLDLLVLNGGISGVPHALSKSGYELQFGTNHMGHTLFTQLLVPLLLKTAAQPGADVRVVAVSSLGAKHFAPAEGIVFDQLKTPMEKTGSMALYGQSKLANALFTRKLAQQYPSIKTASIHPGTVATQIWYGDKAANKILLSVLRPLVRLTGSTSEVGAYNQLWACTSDKVESGSYYDPVGKKDSDPKCFANDELAGKLWDWTNKELAEQRSTSWPSAK